MSKFFRQQPLRNNSFDHIVKRVCENERVTGSGMKNFITRHSLRGLFATIIFKPGNSDSSVMMRTGHRDPRSLMHYQNLWGGEGLQQQCHLMGGPSVRRKGHSVSERASGEAVTVSNSTSNPTGAKKTAPAIRSRNTSSTPVDPTEKVFDMSALRAPFKRFQGSATWTEGRWTSPSTTSASHRPECSVSFKRWPELSVSFKMRVRVIKICNLQWNIKSSPFYRKKF